jgi:hypothetical protein
MEIHYSKYNIIQYKKVGEQMIGLRYKDSRPDKIVLTNKEMFEIIDLFNNPNNISYYIRDLILCLGNQKESRIIIEEIKE